MLKKRKKFFSKEKGKILPYVWNVYGRRTAIDHTGRNRSLGRTTRRIGRIIKSRAEICSAGKTGKQVEKAPARSQENHFKLKAKIESLVEELATVKDELDQCESVRG